MAGELTVSERILYHLNNYVKFEDKYESPFDVTQDGISQACGISRAHAAIELKKLKAAGVVDERLSHVRRGKTRRKVYTLTHSGKSRADDVSRYVKDNGIDSGVDTSRIAPERIGHDKRVRRSSPLPAVSSFFGREKELAEASEALSSSALKVLSIRGIAGIGKTTLAAKLATEAGGSRVFWYTLRSWDSPRNVADALGKFLADNGSRRLGTYLGSGKFELSEISFLLNDELSENGYVFVLDDVDASDGVQEFLRMFRHSSGSAKIISTSEAQPAFYEKSDIVAHREVLELELGGLDRDAALSLLESRGIAGHVAEEMVRATNGHPLSLEMVTESTPAGAKYQVSKFFEEKFYNALEEDEKSLLQLASVFRKPFPSEAIPKELKRARKGSMLRETAPGRFEIHASLRDFVYEHMTKEERAKWHSTAADHYLRSEEPQERLHHLIQANRCLEAEMMIARIGDDLLAGGNVQRLWDSLHALGQPRPKYAQSTTLFKARVANLLGQYRTAWELLERSSGAGDARLKAESLVEMGRIRSKQGELKEASRLFSSSLEVSKELPGTRAKALRGLGVVESKLGNYDKAQELLERSAVDSMSVMDSKGMLLAHLELGNVFIGRGMYEKAIDHFSKCAAGFGPVELTNVFVNMGIACAYLGRNEEARLNFENGVKLADETGQPRAKGYALASLAELLVKTGDASLAKEHCFSALEIMTELDDKLGVSAAYANLGMAERSLGDYRAAEEHLEESLRAIEDGEAPWKLALRKMEFGVAMAEMGQRDRGQKLLEESRAMFTDIGAHDMVSKAEAQLARLRST